MSALVSLKVRVPSLHPLSTAICNVEGRNSELVELGTQDIWRLDGDNRWRVIVCVRGEIWVTQERDLRDYVLSTGDMFIVSQRGSVLIQAFGKACVEITPSLKSVPYRGDYPIFR